MSPEPALPIAPGVTYHSIMGDRGKGNTPESSDGVVPYWSSHLGGAASEKKSCPPVTVPMSIRKPSKKFAAF